MNKKLIALLLTTIMFFVAGCGTSTTTTTSGEEKKDESAESEETVVQETEFYDDAFLSDFSKAIQARWELNQKDAELKDVVEAEYNVISEGDYRSKKYKDSHLGEDVLIYLNALDTQKQILDENNGDLSKVSEEVYGKWQETVMKRYQIIADLYDNYNLSIDSKYTLMINKTHNSLYISKYGEEAFSQMINTWEISEGDSEISLTIQNNTQYTFKDIGIEVAAFVGDEFKGDVFNEEFSGWDPGETKTISWTYDEAKANGVDVDQLKEGEQISLFLYWF